MDQVMGEEHRDSGGHVSEGDGTVTGFKVNLMWSAFGVLAGALLSGFISSASGHAVVQQSDVTMREDRIRLERIEVAVNKLAVEMAVLNERVTRWEKIQEQAK